MSKMNPKVDGYLRKNKKWQKELSALRMIILDCPPLIEDIKWRTPCYTVDNKNVVMIGAFKEACTLSFIKGALLKDPDRILAQPGENTQSVRVIRFTDADQIVKMKPTLKRFIQQAIEVEQSGMKVAFRQITEHKVPQELQERLDKNPTLKAAFRALTPGRQRAYLLYVSSAKQSGTRAARVEKCMPCILKGKGLDD